MTSEKVPFLLPESGTRLTREELEIIRGYFSIPGSLPDPPYVITAKGRVDGPIVARLITDLERARELLREAHGVLKHKGARGLMMDDIAFYLQEIGGRGEPQEATA